jgi:sugar phosphate isomerase/epimerase
MQTVSRRNFLGLSATIAASTLAGRNAWSDPLGLPIGIQLYAVRDPLQTDPAGTMKELFAIGYREVEAAGYGTYTAKDYRKFMDAAGLRCPSAHNPGFKKGVDFGPIFDEAHILGASFITSSSMFPPAPSKPAPFGSALGLDGFKYLVDLMNDIGMKAKAAGLQYAYHNHSHEFELLPDGTPGYDFMLANTDHDLVKFEIDCGWMCAAGHDPAAYMKKYPGRFRMLHIKDFKPLTHPYTTAGSGTRPTGTELGTGFIDYKPIFAASRKAGIVHVFAEQESPFAVSQIESAKVDFAFLKSFS